MCCMPHGEVQGACVVRRDTWCLGFSSRKYLASLDMACFDFYHVTKIYGRENKREFLTQLLEFGNFFFALLCFKSIFLKCCYS